MFYSIAFASDAAGDAPLKTCWQLAHGRKLKKNALLQFSIPDAAELISKPHVALSLRYAPNYAWCDALAFKSYESVVYLQAVQSQDRENREPLQ
jgi:hypothetical protein